MQSYTSRDKWGSREQGHFLVSHKSEPPLLLRTGAEPRAVEGLRVGTVTDTSVDVKWNLPDTNGFTILGEKTTF